MAWSDLLEAGVLKLQRRGVLRDGPDPRFVETVGRDRLDLNLDRDRRARSGEKRSEDLIGDVLEIKGIASGSQLLAGEEARLGRRSLAVPVRVASGTAAGALVSVTVAASSVSIP